MQDFRTSADGVNAPLHKSNLMRLLSECEHIFDNQPNIVYKDIPDGVKLTIVGDIHGQIMDLLHIFDQVCFFLVLRNCMTRV